MKISVKAPDTLAKADDALSILCGRDKSLTHRAIMFASLAQGTSRIRSPLLGADCLSTIACFRALGVTIEVDEEITIRSQGPSTFQEPSAPLDCGNSGTTARLIMGILTAIPGLKTTLIGDESLSQRPMKRVIEPLRTMGAQITAKGDNFLPVSIVGQELHSKSHSIDKASAQIKSCLLLAGLFTRGQTEIRLPRGSRDHTEQSLLTYGAKLKVSFDRTDEILSLQGPFALKPRDVAIPVDPSSAAFFAVLGLLRTAGTLNLPEMLDNPTRTGFVKVLERMSRGISFVQNPSRDFMEPIGTLSIVGGQTLKGTTIEATEVPTLIDEIPILAVAAAFAEGPSLFKDLGELRVKESDRLVLTAKLLEAAGARVEIRGDDLWIAGGLNEVKSFEYDPHGDHRLAMAAAILARRCKNPCCILDSECVRVSFPNFFESLELVNSR